MRIIRKTRKLPLPGDVLVDAGDRVEPGTVVARISQKPGIPRVIPVAGHLGITPAELPSRMVRKVGDRVKAQEVIAVIDRLSGRKEYASPAEGVIEEISGLSGRVVIREEFGKEDPPVTVDVAPEIRCRPSEISRYMLRGVGQEVLEGQMIAKKGDPKSFFARSVVAPITGIISEVSDTTGKVTISRPFKQVEVSAYISGTVAEALPGEGCVIETPGIRMNGIFGVGREAWGELRVLTSGPEEILTPDVIGANLKGKVIVGGSFATNEALAKALETGVAAVVTGTVNYLNLTTSLGVKLGVGITGQEATGMTVVLMEGFGHLAMRREVWEALKALEGLQASVNGMTQIRAGAIRPEIVVPLPSFEGAIGDDGPVDEDLRAGLRVRIVNQPYFGSIGTVVQIVRDPQPVETEALVPAIRVRLQGGQEVMVPRANVEVY